MQETPHIPYTHRCVCRGVAGSGADLEASPEIQTTEIFSTLQKKYPDRFKPGQLRTLQRRVKEWRDWQPEEIYFEQVYPPKHQE